MKRALIVGLVALVVFAGIATGGCASNASEASTAQSDAPRVTSPNVAAGDLAALVAGNGAFAFDLYQVLRGEAGNIFYSPYSVSAALAMTYAGARGETEAQMATTLRYTLAQDRLHPAFNALDLQLASRGQGAKGQDEKGFRLKIANSVWGQTGYKFVPEYLDVLAKNYGAGLRLTDFQQSPEPARVTINNWVKQQTEGKIVDLLPQGSITALTRLVLANAVYFNAAWKYPFEKEATQPGEFTLLNGGKVSVPMMSQLKTHGYAKGQGFQAVELAYDGDEVSMVILLPDEGTMEQFEQSLSGERVSGIVKSLQPKQVQLTMPKYTYSASLSLAKTLKAMGMAHAFTPDQADFSGVANNRELFISDVMHKAIVAVDEKGTEAAAATAVVVGTTSMPMVDVALTVDHPFLFVIRDVKTGTVLFVGRVVNPAA